MAYMNQEKKKKIAAALKAQNLPSDWKISLSVRHHSEIVCTIKSAPASVLDETLEGCHISNGMPQINEFHLDKFFTGETLEILKKIKEALNTDNHDNSDAMSDYFDVGHYVGMQFGNWDRPCVFVGIPKGVTDEEKLVSAVTAAMTAWAEDEANIKGVFHVIQNGARVANFNDSDTAYGHAKRLNAIAAIAVLKGVSCE
jgi:hypothetical protein